MTMTILKNSVAVFAMALLASCSPRMVGTWTVQRFETTKPGQQGVSLNNIGTINFNKNGTGEKKSAIQHLAFHIATNNLLNGLGVMTSM